MNFILLTLFPDMCNAYLSESILGRGAKNGFIKFDIRNIRDYAFNKHRKVDDAPYGGSRGMLMSAVPIAAAIEAVSQDYGKKPYTIYLSPKGKIFDQERAKELKEFDNLLFICGHYEGVDERVIDLFVDEEISIGDYVLTGGELPALTVIDSVARLVTGVLPDEECFSNESIYSGLLEYPQYTRPATFMGLTVPDVLISGHHKNIEDWQLKESLEITKERRPDLYQKYNKK